MTSFNDQKFRNNERSSDCSRLIAPIDERKSVFNVYLRHLKISSRTGKHGLKKEFRRRYKWLEDNSRGQISENPSKRSRYLEGIIHY